MDAASLVAMMDLHRDHQARAVRAALEGLLARGQRGMVLADEVGCGKTYEALAIAALLWRRFKGTRGAIRRILIVAERALVGKWFDEIEAPPQGHRGFQQYVAGPEWEDFRAMLRDVTPISGRWDSTDRGVIEDGKYQVPGTRVYIAKPLPLVQAKAGEASPLVRWLRQTDWDLVIVDEAHHFTGLRSERSRLFFPDQTPESRGQGLTGRFLLALTATPFQLATSELVNLLRIVHAPELDLGQIQGGLAHYERALEQFYARRRLMPADEGRRRWVARLAALRSRDASGGARPGTPGLEELLRRYVIRNVKDHTLRSYSLTERREAGYVSRHFGKLDDLRSLVATSPLIDLGGEDAWVYLKLRDVLTDAQHAALNKLDAKTGLEEDAPPSRERPSFVAGDLRQCLSSYEQLAESAILSKKLPRAEETLALVQRLRARGHAHPKIAALSAVIGALLDREIETLRTEPGQGFHKILVFNQLRHTAGALREALLRTVAIKIDPFVREQIRAAGFFHVEKARNMVRQALRSQREAVRSELRRSFTMSSLRVSRDLLDGTGLEMNAESRELVDVMFGRAEEHCTQPLFLLRLSLWLREANMPASSEAVRTFLSRHVCSKLQQSLVTLVEQYLDDTNVRGHAQSEGNRDRACREISRLARILAAPKYVARFDGSQDDPKREMRRENFNRPYAPLVLLVSKVGEEGIDLQQHTRYVLHYDVEWNPARMEQREGRVDREGRRSQGAVQVQFFLLKDTYEERVFHTVMQRDAWFQVLIGSKRQELARGSDRDPEDGADADVGELENGQLTSEEREQVMLNLRP